MYVYHIQLETQAFLGGWGGGGLSISNIPVMNVAFVITYSDSYISDFADIEMRVVLVIVRCYPANPHAT